MELSGDLLALPEPSERSVALVRPGSPLAVLQYGGLQVFDAKGQSVAAQPITKTDHQEQAVPGETLTHTIIVANDGPDDVVGALISDPFPVAFTGVTWACDDTGGGTCGSASGSGDIGESVDLPRDTSLTFTANGLVDPTATGLLSNTATVEIPEDMTEIDETNNTATDTDAIVVPLFADGFESGDTTRWSVGNP